MRSKPSFIYLLLSGATSFCYSMLLTVELVYLARTVGFDPLQLVLIGTLRQSVCFLFQVPTGILADIYSRRWAVVLGIFLTGTGYLIEGSIPVSSVIFAAQILWGLGVTLTDGADTAWIADEIGVEQAGPVYIRAAQIGSLTSLLGIGSSIVLVNIHLNLPIALGGSLFIVLSLLLALIMPEQHFMPSPRNDRTSWQQIGHTLQAGVQMVRLSPVLLTILSIGVFSGIFSAGFDQLWQYYLLHAFTFPALGGMTSTTWFCIIEAGIVATNFCGIEVARRSVNTNSHRAVAMALFIMNGLMVAGVIGFAAAEQFALAIIAFFLFTASTGPRQPLEQIWMNQNVESSVRATIFSLRGQVSAIAQIIGGLLLGMIAAIFTTRVVLFATGVILSPALLLYARTLRRDKLLTVHTDQEGR